MNCEHRKSGGVSLFFGIDLTIAGVFKTWLTQKWTKIQCILWLICLQFSPQTPMPGFLFQNQSLKTKLRPTGMVVNASSQSGHLVTTKARVGWFDSDNVQSLRWSLKYHKETAAAWLFEGWWIAGFVPHVFEPLSSFNGQGKNDSSNWSRYTFYPHSTNLLFLLVNVVIFSWKMIFTNVDGVC